MHTLVTCIQCNKEFYKRQSQIKSRPNHFCSQDCVKTYQHEILDKSQTLPCKQCSTLTNRTQGQLRKTKNVFCSRSCAAIYNNAHKTHGTRRSKLEIYLESEITNRYPNLPCTYNGKDAIGSELDFYFPDIQLAIELNGIFHYEPIYGNDKLNKIQNNDDQKFKICHEKGISLCVIDTSSSQNCTTAAKAKYWGIVQKIIENHYEIKP